MDLLHPLGERKAPHRRHHLRRGGPERQEHEVLLAALEQPARSRGEEIPSLAPPVPAQVEDHHTRLRDAEGLAHAPPCLRIRPEPLRVAARDDRACAVSRSPRGRLTRERLRHGHEPVDPATGHAELHEVLEPPGRAALADRLLELRPVMPHHRPAPGRHHDRKVVGAEVRVHDAAGRLGHSSRHGPARAPGRTRRGPREEVHRRAARASRSHQPAPRTSSGNP